MRVILQRSNYSSVTVDEKIVGQINKGYVLLTGFEKGDDNQIVSKIAKKIINLRIFNDENDKMNLDLKTINGDILSISQFTLYAKLNGRRPSFSNAMSFDEASKLYDFFNEELRSNGVNVQTGIFGADMKLNINNDGPVTIIFDSKELL